jgi:hypothetical protein
LNNAGTVQFAPDALLVDKNTRFLACNADSLTLSQDDAAKVVQGSILTGFVITSNPASGQADECNAIMRRVLQVTPLPDGSVQLQTEMVDLNTVYAAVDVDIPDISSYGYVYQPSGGVDVQTAGGRRLQGWTSAVAPVLELNPKYASYEGDDIKIAPILRFEPTIGLKLDMPILKKTPSTALLRIGELSTLLHDACNAAFARAHTPFLSCFADAALTIGFSLEASKTIPLITIDVWEKLAEKFPTVATTKIGSVIVINGIYIGYYTLEPSFTVGVDIQIGSNPEEKVTLTAQTIVRESVEVGFEGDFWGVRNPNGQQLGAFTVDPPTWDITGLKKVCDVSLIIRPSIGAKHTYSVLPAGERNTFDLMEVVAPIISPVVTSRLSIAKTIGDVGAGIACDMCDPAAPRALAQFTLTPTISIEGEAKGILAEALNAAGLSSKLPDDETTTWEITNIPLAAKCPSLPASLNILTTTCCMLNDPIQCHSENICPNTLPYCYPTDGASRCGVCQADPSPKLATSEPRWVRSVSIDMYECPCAASPLTGYSLSKGEKFQYYTEMGHIRSTCADNKDPYCWVCVGTAALLGARRFTAHYANTLCRCTSLLAMRNTAGCQAVSPPLATLIHAVG